MIDKLYTYGNMPHKQFPSHREELRDKFAMAVMQGDFAAQDAVEMGYYTNDTPDEFLVKRAEFYYRMADAMLKARG
ncbi:hypothetical protein GWI67_18120 [Proteus sp. G2672]|uniref:hypothetical protein n=1 Tax=Proteus sp. G2672 TaxID=2698884 RepID=UPI001378445B|nr:hypothetical protein [Proteus sp. G2672]NBL79464.1 hypothetical protein [Proteus sp. G2672]